MHPVYKKWGEDAVGMMSVLLSFTLCFCMCCGVTDAVLDCGLHAVLMFVMLCECYVCL